MLNPNPATTSQARFDATDETEKHLRRHGAGLCDLLDALDDPSGFSALCGLICAFDQPFPDANAVEAALHQIHRVLAEQAPSSLDRIGHQRNLPASNMARWYGARISELIARFRAAD
ncbi:hypothetical protein SAMN05444398_11299 [Roseovarius pacificus]|uniref:Uncharacterized protein n=2 Tax=Roseovarius pacificus TaxID=337701 RepID=A0A1M7HEF8_9RHOB|nr:hypothetical protein GCM10011315_27750 [Roseovarius pacificus]SHM26527.1 hypothetical protein SAMN05444398_11299 [Roseovarius pacificus]